MILADGDTILPRHLNLSFVETSPDAEPVNPLGARRPDGIADRRHASGVTVEVERVKIEQMLNEAEGNKGRAAELLQISYKMLVSRS